MNAALSRCHAAALCFWLWSGLWLGSWLWLRLRSRGWSLCALLRLRRSRRRCSWRVHLLHEVLITVADVGSMLGQEVIDHLSVGVVVIAREAFLELIIAL